MKRIDVRNSDYFEDESKKYKLSRNIKRGIIISALVVSIPFFMQLEKYNKENNNPPADISEFEEPVLEEPINVSIQELNTMNIIIDDNECSDVIMNGVYSKLENDGIKFTKSKNGNNINIENGIVFSLDQKYMAGPGMLVIAPVENEGTNNSDVLAITTDTAFYEKGFITDGIECGLQGFEEDENGNLVERVKTETEKKIDKNKNISFTTIEFGTSGMNADLIASAIENSLVRYYSYINYNNIDEDLVYRTEKEDTIDKLASKFGASINSIKSTNKLNSNTIYENTTIINPAVNVIREFNRSVPVDLYIEKTIWSK